MITNERQSQSYNFPVFQGYVLVSNG